GQLVDVVRLVDDDDLLFQGLVEGQDVLGLDAVGAVDEEDGQVVLRVRAGEAQLGGRFGGPLLLLRRRGQGEQGQAEGVEGQASGKRGEGHGSLLPSRKERQR